MSEAVTVPSLKMMTSTVSEESLETDRHTDRHTHRLVVVNVKTCNLAYDFANKPKKGDGGYREGCVWWKELHVQSVPPLSLPHPTPRLRSPISKCVGILQMLVTL